jgi:hypothetical protein
MAEKFRSNEVDFIYNPDLTGEVLIRRSKRDKDNNDMLRIPTEALFDMVADIIRKKKMNKIALQSSMEILNDLK